MSKKSKNNYKYNRKKEKDEHEVRLAEQRNEKFIDSSGQAGVKGEWPTIEKGYYDPTNPPSDSCHPFSSIKFGQLREEVKPIKEPQKKPSLLTRIKNLIWKFFTSQSRKQKGTNS
jgi:hypothetical protein